MSLFRLRPLDKIARRLGPSLVWLYLHLLGKTQRLQVEGRDYLAETRRGNGPFLFAFWHNRLLFPVYLYRSTGVGVLISPSRDGEYIARTVERFGFTALRGSSYKNPSAGLAQLARHVRKGYSVAVTPDGPRGPRERAQPGVLELAKVSGIPVVPCAYSPGRRLTLRSWDGFIVPLPFCRAAVVYREPIHVPRDATREEMESLRCRLEQEINAATDRADFLVGRAGTKSEE